MNQMICPNCRRSINLINGFGSARHRYVCGCGWVFDSEFGWLGDIPSTTSSEVEPTKGGEE